MALLVATTSSLGRDYHKALKAIAPDREIRLWPEAGRAEDIRYCLAWKAPSGVLAALPKLELIISVGAGVDHLFVDATLPRVPIVRFVDPDLSGRMAQYVALHVLYHSRRMCELSMLQRQRKWVYLPEPAAHEIRVGLMGLGNMGLAAARALQPLGYRINGWSRTKRELPDIECFHGAEGRDPFLACTDILVVTLPLTPETRGILDRTLIRKLSLSGRHPRLPGPVLINAGRGGLQIEADVLAALDARELYAASLDVFEIEPLPPASPLWSHPRVVVTPHNAAESTPEAIARYTIRQIEAKESGAALENLVDRNRQY
jgi:glyoxylate/hydroxypyruvate reductase A